MKPSSLVRLVLCLGFLAALTGCNTTHKQDTGLSIEVSRFERAADGTAKVQLILLNPSVMAYNIAESTHKLYLGGRYAGRLRFKEAVGLAPQNQSAMETVLLPERGFILPPTGPIDYRLETELELRLYGDTVEYTKLAATGTVAVSGR